MLIPLGFSSCVAFGQAGLVDAPSAQILLRGDAIPRVAAPQATQSSQNDQTAISTGPGLTNSVWQWRGVRVDSIEFEGVTFDNEDTLPSELPQKAGEPFDPEKVRASTRRLFDSGRYRDINVRALRHGNGVTLIYSGTPRYYVGRVTITGVKSDRLSSLLEYGTKLSPGNPYTDSSIPNGTEGIREILRQNGYYEPKVFVGTTLDKVNNQIDIVYNVEVGTQARIGNVTIDSADLGMTVDQFRKKGKLKQGSKVTRDTTTTALSRLRTQYQKKNRLEATVSVQNQTYDPTRRQVDYAFRVNQGPEVKVIVEGATISKSRLHLLVPVFEEGTIDNDLLNEGSHNLRDFVQQQGYFDAAVDVKLIGEGTPDESVVFVVDRGIKHKVLSVTLKGNKYFSDEILRERMQVKKADAYQRSGRYSPSLVASDVASIQSLYRANGFDEAQIKTDVKDSDASTGKPGQIVIVYNVVEGPQKKFGKVDLIGVDPSRLQDVRSLLNTQEGQPYSLVTLAGDRDTVLTYYLSHGFDQAKVDLKLHKDTSDATRTDVALTVGEGQQVFVDRVLLSGLQFTRPNVVENRILVHSGDPIDQSALLETQRNLYNLALFNEVITAVQNPNGNAPRKNALIQVTEAKRWNVTYGFGFEAQTGNPGGTLQTNGSSGSYGTEGRASVSPRVSLDVSRINFRGSEDSITLHSTYGLLEQIAVLTFQNPHLYGAKNLSAALSGGYTNIQNITTFASSTLQGDFRVTQKYKRADTIIYDVLYRRVRVDPNSLRVSQDLIPLLSQPVRVAGPGLTWFHDTDQGTIHHGADLPRHLEVRIADRLLEDRRINHRLLLAL
jgi:outer membrane protein assembly factor BamA